MSMVALISTVTNQSRRRLTNDLAPALVVNVSTIHEPELINFAPLVIEPAMVENESLVHVAAFAFVVYQDMDAAHIANASLIHPPQIEVDEGLVLVAAHIVNINYFSVPTIVSGAGGSVITTNYANEGGEGDRSDRDVWVRASNGASVPIDQIEFLLNGILNDNNWYAGGSSDLFLTFEFLYPVVITEARFTQSNGSSHGDFKWQGSNDNASWSDIGASFALGGVSVQTLTELQNNETAYRFYRLFQVSGATSGSPYWYEFEFKIGFNPSSYSFLNGEPLNSGDRSSLFTITHDGFANLGGPISHFVNGSNDNNWYCNGGQTAAFVKFDLGSGNEAVLRGARILRSGPNESGDWQFQGSKDDSTWDILSHTIRLDRVRTSLFAPGNTTAYRYYKIQQVGGSTSGSPYWQEVTFAQDDGMLGGGGGDPAPEAEFFPETVVNVSTINGPEFINEDGVLQLTPAHIVNASTIHGAELEIVIVGDPLWSNVIFLMDTQDHSAAAESERVRHHSADGNLGQFIPLSNAYYTTAQKLPGRDYSIGGGIANDHTTIFGLDLNSGAFTIEARVRRNSTQQSLLMHQGVGSSVFRFGFELGSNTRLWFSYTTNGVTWINLFSVAAVVSATHAWKHIAVDRGADNVLRLFADGVMVAKSTLAFVVPTPIDTKLNVGASLTSGGLLFMDDVRLTMGANRYGSDASFTPPAALERGPLPDPHWSNVVALQRFNARAGYLGKPSIAVGQVYLADASKAGAHDEGAGGCELVSGDPTALASVGGGFVRTKATGAAGVNLAGAIAWTIEARAELANVANVAGVLCARESVWTTSPGATDKQWRLGFTSDGKPYFEAVLADASTFTLTAAAALTKAVQYDLAADCDGSTVRLYADGAMIAKATMAAAIANNAPSTKAFYMFGGSGSGRAGFPGSLDEVRVTKAVARYNCDAGYTPAVGRFPAY